MPTLTVLPNATPNQLLIDALKSLQTQAESGQIQTMVFAATYIDGDIETGVITHNGGLKTFTMLGAIEWLRTRVVDMKVKSDAIDDINRI